jgi:adenosylmethionine-8-amino-7-oxononanoate aminotransferase
MAGRSGKTGVTPGWYDPELPHVWLPYAQMKTVSPPLPVVGDQGAPIFFGAGAGHVDGVPRLWNARQLV